MSYIALYRKWRPFVFEDVVEQDYVVKTLKNSIKSDRVAHAYLFCGSRGTGKTSIAKIFSRAINCLSSVDGNPCNKCTICKGVLSGRNIDVIEIDAASNNGVDNVREIRDEVVYTPAESKYKVYIIDEVHMLSQGAFNALLKTLEEPPSHVVFILATTEPHKLPSTILSRCQRFDFKRISIDGMAVRIKRIAEDNGFNLYDDSAKLISKLAEGGLRDAISILDKCISAGNKELTVSEVMSVVGMVSHTFVQEMANSILVKDIPAIFSMAGELVNSGKDVKHFVSELIYFFRDCLILKLTKDVNNLSYPLYDDMELLLKKSQNIEESLLMSIIKDLSNLENAIRWSRNPRITLEIALIKLCERKFTDSLDQLNTRLSELELKISKGSFHLNADNNASVSSYNAQNTNNIYINEDNTKLDSSSNKSIYSSDSKTANQPNYPNESKSSLESKPIVKKQRPIVAGARVTFWNEVIEKAKSMGRMTIYANLLDSTASFLGENTIIINHTADINRMALQRDNNLCVLQDIIKNVANVDVSVKFAETTGSSASNDSNCSAIQKAKNMAQIANIPLNIIDD